jgi:hypothetical protein
VHKYNNSKKQGKMRHVGSHLPLLMAEATTYPSPLAMNLSTKRL